MWNFLVFLSNKTLQMRVKIILIIKTPLMISFFFFLFFQFSQLSFLDFLHFKTFQLSLNCFFFAHLNVFLTSLLSTLSYWNCTKLFLSPNLIEKLCLHLTLWWRSFWGRIYFCTLSSTVYAELKLKSTKTSENFLFMSDSFFLYQILFVCGFSMIHSSKWKRVLTNIFPACEVSLRHLTLFIMTIDSARKFSLMIV